MELRWGAGSRLVFWGRGGALHFSGWRGEAEQGADQGPATWPLSQNSRTQDEGPYLGRPSPGGFGSWGLGCGLVRDESRRLGATGLDGFRRWEIMSRRRHASSQARASSQPQGALQPVQGSRASCACPPKAVNCSRLQRPPPLRPLPTRPQPQANLAPCNLVPFPR